MTRDDVSVSIQVEFTGGLETLFSNQRAKKLTYPREKEDSGAATTTNTTVSDLIADLATNHVQQDKKDLFVLGSTVRPGILVLINDADWELEGEGSYQLRDGDRIVFVSTLHGG